VRVAELMFLVRAFDAARNWVRSALGSSGKLPWMRNPQGAGGSGKVGAVYSAFDPVNIRERRSHSPDVSSVKPEGADTGIYGRRPHGRCCCAPDGRSESTRCCFRRKQGRTRRRPMTCDCDHRWVCEDHPDRPTGHDGCDGAGSQCPNPQCYALPRILASGSPAVAGDAAFALDRWIWQGLFEAGLYLFRFSNQITGLFNQSFDLHSCEFRHSRTR
jgi:hypothetical protein